LNLVFDKTSCDDAVKDVSERQSYITAIEDGAVPDIHPTGVFNSQACSITGVNDVEPRESTVWSPSG
jgi:hypothetical protein